MNKNEIVLACNAIRRNPMLVVEKLNSQQISAIAVSEQEYREAAMRLEESKRGSTERVRQALQF